MSARLRPLRGVLLCGVFALLSGALGCSSELSTDELLAALRAQKITVEDAQQERSQMQREVDNLSHAMATDMPMPKLARTLKLDGVVADIYWCPGKNKQARTVMEVNLRGPQESDPPTVAMMADSVTGRLNIPFQSHLISMSPTLKNDEDALGVVVALSKIK